LRPFFLRGRGSRYGVNFSRGRSQGQGDDGVDGLRISFKSNGHALVALAAVGRAPVRAEQERIFAGNAGRARVFAGGSEDVQIDGLVSIG